MAPSCYTLFKHPRVMWDTAYEEVDDNRCNTCHQSDELWSFHHPPNHRYQYGFGYEPWQEYYLPPWWYNDYWYYDTNEATTVPLRSRGFRPGVDKDPYTSGGTLLPGTAPSLKTPVSPKATDSNKGKANNESSKNRTVRPNKSKEKPPPEKEKG